MSLILLVKILQILSAVLLTFLVLIQSSSGGLSGTFGGSFNMYRSKRGVEKLVFILTIFFSAVLVLNSLVLINLF